MTLDICFITLLQKSLCYISLNLKMGTLKDNNDIACYFITKHSWKGK